MTGSEFDGGLPIGTGCGIALVAGAVPSCFGAE